MILLFLFFVVREVPASPSVHGNIDLSMYQLRSHGTFTSIDALNLTCILKVTHMIVNACDPQDMVPLEFHWTSWISTSASVRSDTLLNCVL